MKQKNTPFQMKTTVDFMPTHSKWRFKKSLWRFKKSLLAVLCGLAFLLGLIIGPLIWPQTITVEKEKIVEVKVPYILPKTQWDKIEEEGLLHERAEIRANQKVIDMLENCVGFMRIRDGEAENIAHRRAAVCGKSGFVDLENNRPYRILWYFNHNSTGRGIVDMGEKKIFLLEWVSGKTKAPLLNPGAIIIPAGKNIQTTSSQF